MKTKLTLFALVALLTALMLSCGKKEPAAPTEGNTPAVTASDADAPTADEPEAAPAEEAAPEPEAAPEAAPAVEEAPAASVQPDLPFTKDGAYDLSNDIFVTDFSLEEGNGQWILGDDNAQMSDPLTESLLKEYKYFVITYEASGTDDDSAVALMFKYHHDDDTKTEYLCENWMQWGPAGATFAASSFAAMPVYEEGAFYVPTSQFLENENYRSGDIIDQMGLAAVEWSGTYVDLSITGAFLAK